jgi:phosphoribosylglycinamide formyltransferase 1
VNIAAIGRETISLFCLSYLCGHCDKSDSLMQRKINIAVFASGSGSNAENLIHYFKNHAWAEVTLIVCNNPDAYVLKRAAKLGVESIITDRAQWKNPDELVKELRKRDIGLIVLAGFLWLIPEPLIDAFPHRIINIHPALLPKYGGKGMYGDAVHHAVKANKETETGITVHFVNAHYDEGDIIFQKSTGIDPDTHSHEEIASKVHDLEYEWYPKVVEDLVIKLKD